MAPLDRMVSEVFAVAKRDLKPGDILDGIGGCAFYSLIDRYETAAEERLLPIGLAKGAKVVRPVAKDRPITLEDVELREPSTVLSLRRLQNRWMSGGLKDEKLLEAIEQIAAE